MRTPPVRRSGWMFSLPSAERERDRSDERQMVAVRLEFLVCRQLQVRSRLLGGEAVREAERAAARARAVAAPQAQALELEGGCRAIAASQLSRIAERLGGAVFPGAGQPGFRSRM